MEVGRGWAENVETLSHFESLYECLSSGLEQVPYCHCLESDPEQGTGKA